jgi:CRISPR-associated protein Cmr5
MNKRVVDAWIPVAYQAISRTKIANEKDEVEKSFRGQISTLGASIEMGSLLSAVAFFSAQGSSTIERQKLVKAIYFVIMNSELSPAQLAGDEKIADTALYKYVCQNADNIQDYRKAKEKVLNAAIAIKLALNLFKLGSK